MRTRISLGFALVFIAQALVLLPASAAPAPSVSSISPAAATLNQSSTFVVSGSNMTNSLAFFIENCANVQNIARGTKQQKFSCTPQKSGSLAGVVKDKPNGRVLRNFRVEVKAPSPIVTSVAPLSATINQTTTFTVNGSNLPDTLAFFIADCANLAAVKRSAMQQSFKCTPQKAGNLAGLVKDKPNGATLRTFSLAVAAPAPTVASVSPLAANLNAATTFTITGKNLPMTIAYDIADCKDKKLVSYSATRVQFSCTPAYSAGQKAGVIKDKPSGKTLRSFTVAVKAVAKIDSVTFGTAELNKSLTVTASGVLLPADLQLSMPSCNQVKRLQYSSAKHIFSCTPIAAGQLTAKVFSLSNAALTLSATVKVADDVGDTLLTARLVGGSSQSSANIYNSTDLDVYKVVLNGGYLAIETTGSILTLVTISDEKGNMIDQVVSGQQNLASLQQAIVTMFSLPALGTDALNIGGTGKLSLQLNPGTYYVTVESLVNMVPVKDSLEIVETIGTVRGWVKKAAKQSLNESIQSTLGQWLIETSLTELAWGSSGLAKAANGEYTLVSSFTSAGLNGETMWVFPIDVNPTDWFYQDVYDLLGESGAYVISLMDFQDQGRFYPSANVTRAKSAQWLTKAIREYPGWFEPAQLCTSAPFDDVLVSDQLICSPVQYLKNLGIVSGDNGSNLFRPDEALNRAEVSKLFVKAFRLPLRPCTEKPFSDVEVGAWHCPYIKTLASAGVIKGYANGTFLPAGKINRAEYIHMLNEAMRYATKQGTMDLTKADKESVVKEVGQIVCSGPIEACLGGDPVVEPQPETAPDGLGVLPLEEMPTPVFVAPHDGNDTFDGAVRLLENQAFSSSIDHTSDLDMYVFTPLKRNGIYSLQTFGRRPDGSIMPSRGRLYDQNKALLTTFELSKNVSGIIDGHFYGYYPLVVGQTYYLEVTHAYGETGQYDVVIQGPTYTNDQDDIGNDWLSGYWLMEKELVKGQIEVKQDEDYFTFVPITDGDYVVELNSTNMFQATLMADSYWIGVMDGSNYRKVMKLRGGVALQIRVINVDPSFREGNNPYTVRVFPAKLLGTI